MQHAILSSYVRYHITKQVKLFESIIADINHVLLHATLRGPLCSNYCNAVEIFVVI